MIWDDTHSTYTSQSAGSWGSGRFCISNPVPPLHLLTNILLPAFSIAMLKLFSPRFLHTLEVILIRKPRVVVELPGHSDVLMTEVARVSIEVAFRDYALDRGSVPVPLPFSEGPMRYLGSPIPALSPTSHGLLVGPVRYQALREVRI